MLDILCMYCLDGEVMVEGLGQPSNKSCVFRNNEPNLVTFYEDQQITEDVVEFPSGTELVSTHSYCFRRKKAGRTIPFPVVKAQVQSYTQSSSFIRALFNVDSITLEQSSTSTSTHCIKRRKES